MRPCISLLLLLTVVIVNEGFQMADEKPVQVKSSKPQKQGKGSSNLKCIIHYDRNTDDTQIRKLSDFAYQKIKQCVLKRQESEFGQESKICAQIPDVLDENCHGIHRWCYQTFTNIYTPRKRPHNGNDCPTHSASKVPRLKETSILFPKCCLFCGKAVKRMSGVNEYLTKCVTRTSEQSIKNSCEKKGDEDLVRKIYNQDLIAKEAMYHNSCRRDYTRRRLEKAEKRCSEQTSLHESHNEAFKKLCQYVDSVVIAGANIIRMRMLKEKYLSYIREHCPDHYNPNYKTEKLKEKLSKHYGDKLQFWQPNYKSDLVYSDGIHKGEAIEVAFEKSASDERFVEDCAMMLRRRILDAKLNAANLPWPPPVTMLMNDPDEMPNLLKVFLTTLISGSQTSEITRMKRLVSSFCQDLCYAATNGAWKMPKHLLLGMTVRHMTGSAELLTLINRFGHCQSYSQILELETAMYRSQVAQDTVLPPTIHPHQNSVTHLCWDNFDLNEETPSGSGTTHTTHGIVIKEKTMSVEDVRPLNNECLVQRNKKRSVEIQLNSLVPSYSRTKVEPVISVNEVSGLSSYNVAPYENSLMWIFSRLIMKGNTQCIPSWAGWLSLSCTSDNEASVDRCSTVDYMPPIKAPITDNDTVYEVLRLSQEVTRQVGQNVTIVTFDLAVAKKAYNLLWQYPDKFQNVVIRLGVFHTMCSFMKGLGKQMRHSGFEEILMESGVCASGSIEKVMNGSHYNRAIRIHKLTLEAFERLLIQRYERTEGSLLSEESISEIKHMAEFPNQSSIEIALSHDNVQSSIQKYLKFKDEVRGGLLGNTAKFWLDYMDKVWLLLQFLKATKQNNLDLHISCLQSMIPQFFAFDQPNYARYATIYLCSLLNLSDFNPGADALLRQNGFSVNRSEVPSCRNAVDMTIEQTINRHAKSNGGIIGFSRNFSAYHRWCMTRHARASYVRATLDIAGLDATENSAHKDLRNAQIAQSEADVEKIFMAVENFMNPFEIDQSDTLFCISSGMPANEGVKNGLMHVNEKGHDMLKQFVEERLIRKEKSFHDPIKKSNIPTFASLTKSVVLTSSKHKSKELTAERNVFGQLVLLAIRHQLCLERILTYPLGPVPWSLATADGMPAKTDKAKLLHVLEKDAIESSPVHANCHIIDGNAMLHMQINLPKTFGCLASSIFEQLPKADRVDFVTDSYKELSIKEIERERRGSSKALLISGPLTTIPRDWKSFLQNEKNKEQSLKLFLSEWKKDDYAKHLVGRVVNVALGGTCTRLSSTDGKTVESYEEEALESNHEEADTRMISHLVHMSANIPSTSNIIVRSPDTDVLVLLLNFASNIEQDVFFDTGVGNKRRQINVKRIVQNIGSDLATSLLGFHSFTGCDSTSCFFRKGKVKPLKILQKYPEFTETFKMMGNSLEIDDDIFSSLEKFTCLMYGSGNTTDINKLRYELFLQKFTPKPGEVLSSYDGVDLSLLPPCKTSLDMHIRRCNYQSFIWQNSVVGVYNLPSPIGNGWKCNLPNKVAVEWTDNKMMPDELVDLLVENDQTDNDDIPDFNNNVDSIFCEDEESHV